MTVVLESITVVVEFILNVLLDFLVLARAAMMLYVQLLGSLPLEIGYNQYIIKLLL